MMGVRVVRLILRVMVLLVFAATIAVDGHASGGPMPPPPGLPVNSAMV